jgi:hypothetical protein
MGCSGGGNDGSHRTQPGCPWRTWPRFARAALGSEVEGGDELRDEGAEGERRVALDGRDLPPMREGRAGNMATMVGECSCMEATPWTRAARWSIFLSTWHAAMWPRWDEIWAGFRADSGLGPNTKFVAHTLHYVFHLMVMVIRAIN